MSEVTPLSLSPIEPLSLSPDDAAEHIGISRSQVYILLGDGKLKARKAGGRTLIDYSSIKAYHASLPDYVPGVPIPNAPKSRKARRS